MTEPSRTKVSEEELTYHVIDDRRAVLSPWGKGNSKLGRGIYTLSRLPGRQTYHLWKDGTCPGATELCLKVCYSMRFRYNRYLWSCMFDNTCNLWKEIPPLPSDAKIVRAHVSGDFDTPEYIDMWGRLCTKNPLVEFFAYTRSWRVPELLPKLSALQCLPNMQLFASMDESTPEEPPDGWRVAWLVEPDSLSKFVLSRSGKHTMVCPEETGEKPNCESCGFCFKATKGDVIFELREL